jgi:hypothetical protein
MSRRLIVDDLIAEVRSLIDEINVDNISDEQDILPSLNRGQDYIASVLARRYEEPLLKNVTIPLVGGQELYDVPDDAFESRIEKMEAYVGRISFRDVTNYEYPSYTTLPEYYTIIGKQYKLIPAPSSSSYQLRLWYLKDPEPLVKKQGQITLVNTASNYIIVDEIGPDLTTNMDKLNSYVNIIDGDTGDVRATLQIQVMDDQRITFKTVPTRTSVLGHPVSGSFTAEDIRPDDYITTVHGSCICFFKKPLSNFLVTFAAADIKVNKLGGEPGLLAQQLDAFEKQVEKMWVGQEQTLRVSRVNGHFGTRRRRRFIFSP